MNRDRCECARARVRVSTCACLRVRTESLLGEQDELSKISNPTNLIGEPPSDGVRLWYRFLWNSDEGIYFFFTWDGYVCAKRSSFRKRKFRKEDIVTNLAVRIIDRQFCRSFLLFFIFFIIFFLSFFSPCYIETMFSGYSFIGEVLYTYHISYRREAYDNSVLYLSSLHFLISRLLNFYPPFFCHLLLPSSLPFFLFSSFFFSLSFFFF